MDHERKGGRTSILQMAKVAKIFGKIWSYGKSGVAISLASFLSAQVVAPPVSANPPARPGSVNPTGFSVVMNGASTPVHSTATPATIPASLISAIINASGSTNLQKSQVIDVGNYPGGTLSFAGNFVNQSNLILISSNPGVSTATIKADNIFNSSGAMITTLLPSSGLSGYNLSSLVNNLSLQLFANHTIANAGTISSAANLSISAPQVINAQVANTSSAAAPLITANQNLNIFSPNIANSGTISSTFANVNVAGLSSATTQNILFNNAGGLVQALNGSINFRDPVLTDKVDTTILGGDFVAKNLALNSGNGILTVDVHDISKPLTDIICGDVHLYSESSLNLGTLKVTGDPTIESGSDILLVKDPQTGDTAAPLEVIAKGNIINVSCKFISGTGDVNYIAGGSIDLTGITDIFSPHGGIYLTALGGDVIAPSAKITSGGIPSHYIPVGVYSGLVDATIGIYAHGNVIVGPIRNPSGVVLLRAGGEAQGDVLVSGFNPGNVIASKIDVSTFPGNPTNGSILIDTGGGSISTGNLIGAGGRMLVAAPLGNVTIEASDSALPAISNSGLVARTGQYFQADTQIVGQNVTIDGGSIVAGNGLFVINSSLPDTGTVNFKVDSILANDTKGTGSIFNVVAPNINFLPHASFFSVEAATKVANADSLGDSFVYFSAVASGKIIVDKPMVVDGNSQFKGASGAAISFLAQEFNAKSLNISAQGNDVGSGGLIALAGYDNFQVDTTNLHLNANGGSGGNGGTVSVISGSGLTINTSAFSAVAGQNANGGTVILDASSNSGGNLVVIGPINVDGNGTGSGGVVRLANGRSSFLLGTGGGVSSVSAQSGSTGGDGGSITVSSGGDLTIKTSALKAAARGEQGNGGSISLLAGFTGDPNDNNTRVFDGTLRVTGAINVDGKGQGNGGNVFLLNGNSPFVIGESGGNVSSVFARGGLDGGNGGSVVAQSGGDLIAKTSNLSVAVRGADGAGGNVSLSAGYRNGVTSSGGLTVNGNINVSGKGEGRGGTIGLQAYSTGSNDGDGGGVVVAALAAPIAANATAGQIVVNGNLIANGGASGNGGAISLSSLLVPGTSGAYPDSTSSIIVSGGSIRADGGTTSGDGGVIQVNAFGELSFDSDISASAKGKGNGGQITFNLFNVPSMDPPETSLADLTLNGDVRADGKGLIADGVGYGGLISFNNAVGDLSVHGKLISVNSPEVDGLGKISLLNPSGEAKLESVNLVGIIDVLGTDIDVAASGKNVSLNVGNVVATFGNAFVSATGSNSILNVLSGSIVSAAGNDTQRGRVDLQSGKSITVAENALVSVNGSDDQVGGDIFLNTGLLGNKGQVTISGSLQANGRGSGSGGNITIYGDQIYIGESGKVLAGADSAGSGAAGEVYFKNSSDRDITLNIAGIVSTPSPDGQPATVHVLPFNDTKGSATINLFGKGSIEGDFAANAKNISINFQIENSPRFLVKELTAKDGNIVVTSKNPGQEIQLLGKISASGNVRIQAALITFLDSGITANKNLVISSTGELKLKSVFGKSFILSESGLVRLSGTGIAIDNLTIRSVDNGDGGILSLESQKNISLNNVVIDVASTALLGSGGQISIGAKNELKITSSQLLFSGSVSGGKLMYHCGNLIIENSEVISTGYGGHPGEFAVSQILPNAIYPDTVDISNTSFDFRGLQIEANNITDSGVEIKAINSVKLTNVSIDVSLSNGAGSSNTIGISSNNKSVVLKSVILNSNAANIFPGDVPGLITILGVGVNISDSLITSKTTLPGQTDGSVRIVSLLSDSQDGGVTLTNSRINSGTVDVFGHFGSGVTIDRNSTVGASSSAVLEGNAVLIDGKIVTNTAAASTTTLVSLGKELILNGSVVTGGISLKGKPDLVAQVNGNISALDCKVSGDKNIILSGTGSFETPHMSMKSGGYIDVDNLLKFSGNTLLSLKAGGAAFANGYGIKLNLDAANGIQLDGVDCSQGHVLIQNQTGGISVAGTVKAAGTIAVTTGNSVETLQKAPPAGVKLQGQAVIGANVFFYGTTLNESENAVLKVSGQGKVSLSSSSEFPITLNKAKIFSGIAFSQAAVPRYERFWHDAALAFGDRRNVEIVDNNISLSDGSILIKTHSKQKNVYVGVLILELKANSMALIEYKNGAVFLWQLQGTTVVRCRQKPENLLSKLNPGMEGIFSSELVVLKSAFLENPIARRNSCQINRDAVKGIVSDFSPAGLVKRSDLTATLLREQSDKTILNVIFKCLASIHTVSAKYGPYAIVPDRRLRI